MIYVKHEILGHPPIERKCYLVIDAAFFIVACMLVSQRLVWP